MGQTIKNICHKLPCEEKTVLIVYSSDKCFISNRMSVLKFQDLKPTWAYAELLTEVANILYKRKIV